MSIENSASVDAFGAFSIAGTLAGTAVNVIVDKSVDVVDFEGNVRHCAAVAHFIKADLPTWTAGASLVTGDGNYTLRQKVSDDGFVIKIEATPTA